MDTPRGFTLLIAMILTSVVLSVGLALLDISYKQVVLASTAKNSVNAFYAANSALECALYWDSKDQFDYTKGVSSGTISCQSQSINYTTLSQPPYLVTTFSVSCTGGGSDGTVSLYKTSTAATHIYANGFNTCSSNDTHRTQRGVQANY